MKNGRKINRINENPIDNIIRINIPQYTHSGIIENSDSLNIGPS